MTVPSRRKISHRRRRKPCGGERHGLLEYMESIRGLLLAAAAFIGAVTALIMAVFAA